MILHALRIVAEVWLLVGLVLLLSRHLRPCGIAWLLWPPSLVLPPLLVPFALLACEWEDWRVPFGNGRHHLPAWASWLDTPDQMLPGDLSIPTVRSIYDRWGWFICSWYWLGWRNPAQGLAWSFGKDVAAPWWTLEPGYFVDPSGSGLWWSRRPIFGGRLQLKSGWRPYPNPAGGWRLVPCLTITKP